MARFDNDGWVINRNDERSASGTSERALFIQRTYIHLAFALLALVGLEYVMLRVIDPEPIVRMLFGRGSMGLLVVVLAFMGVSYLAQTWARSNTSRAVQYMGLGLYVVAQAIILLPILFVADRYFPAKEGQISIIWQAAIMTLCVFAGLTIAAFTTKKDFSFLGPIISIGSMLALGLIIASLLAGFSLGLFFSFAMVALLAACILWETSQLMYHYNTEQYVAAALGLFASVATLFFYILRILMAFSGRE